MVFKMAGILILAFNKGESEQEKVALKLRREFFWHELAAKFTEESAEELDPEKVRVRKVLRKTDELSSITHYYESQKHRWEIKYNEECYSSYTDYYWHDKRHGASMVYQHGVIAWNTRYVTWWHFGSQNGPTSNWRRKGRHTSKGCCSCSRWWARR